MTRPSHEPAPTPLRALFVNENIGGNATMHVHLARTLAAEHPEVAAAFLDVPRRRGLRRLAGAAVPGLGRLDLDFAPLRGQLALSAHVRRRLARWPDPYDVLHVYTHNAGLLSVGAIRRTPSVVGLDATTLQSTRLLPYRRPTRFTPWTVRPAQALERRVYAAADAVVAKSDWARRSLIDDYGVEPERIALIPYGIAVPEPPAVERAADTIVFVGRSLARKGGHLLLEAWRRHLRPHVRLVLVTPEPVPPEPGLTVVAGLRPGDARLWELLAGAAVLAFPSIADTFGYAALEAMAVGTPVVGADVGATPELVADGETGLLVPPEDPEALAAGLEALLGDRPRRERMGHAARARVLERFDARVTTRRVVELLRSLRTVDER